MSSAKSAQPLSPFQLRSAAFIQENRSPNVPKNALQPNQYSIRTEYSSIQWSDLQLNEPKIAASAGRAIYTKTEASNKAATASPTTFSETPVRKSSGISKLLGTPQRLPLFRRWKDSRKKKSPVQDDNPFGLPTLAITGASWSQETLKELGVNEHTTLDPAASRELHETRSDTGSQNSNETICIQERFSNIRRSVSVLAYKSQSDGYLRRRL